jgi:hypothetical protein
VVLQRLGMQAAALAVAAACDWCSSARLISVAASARCMEPCRVHGPCCSACARTRLASRRDATHAFLVASGADCQLLGEPTHLTLVWGGQASSSCTHLHTL